MYVSVQPFGIENRHEDVDVEGEGQRRKDHVLIWSRDTHNTAEKNIFVHKPNGSLFLPLVTHFLSSALHLTLNSQLSTTSTSSEHIISTSPCNRVTTVNYIDTDHSC